MKLVFGLIVLAALFLATAYAQSELTPHERFWCYNYYQSGCDSEPRIAPEEKADASRLEFGPLNRVNGDDYIVSYVGLELQDGCAPQEAGVVFTYAAYQRFANLTATGSGASINTALVTPFFANSDRGRSFSNVWGSGMFQAAEGGDDDQFNIWIPFYFTSLFSAYNVRDTNDVTCRDDKAPTGFEKDEKCIYRANNATLSGDVEAKVIYAVLDRELIFIAPAVNKTILDDMKRAGDAANTVIYHDFDLPQPQEYPRSLDRDLVHKFPRGWEIFYIPDCKQFMVKLTNWQTVDLERTSNNAQQLLPADKYWCYNYYQSSCDAAPRAVPTFKVNATCMHFGPYNNYQLRDNSDYVVPYVYTEPPKRPCAVDEAGIVFSYNLLQQFRNDTMLYLANSDLGRAHSGVWGVAMVKQQNCILFRFLLVPWFDYWKSSMVTGSELHCAEERVPAGFVRVSNKSCEFASKQQQDATQVTFAAQGNKLLYMGITITMQQAQEWKELADDTFSTIYQHMDMPQPQRYPSTTSLRDPHRFPQAYEIFFVPDCAQFMVKLVNWISYV